MNANGRIIYQGPSLLDGQPIVAILTGVQRSSRNAKTGLMLQTWILRSDIDPQTAVKTGEDVSVCGNCPHRKAYLGSCYVLVYQAPLAVYRSFERGSYPVLSLDTEAHLLEGKGLRIGSYGDPAAVPMQVWNDLLTHVRFHTGYTHQWRDCNEEYNQILMASADTLEDRLDAHKLGYRTFRVKPEGDITKVKGEMVCPASKENGYNLTCIECKACGGISSTAVADVSIQAHGRTGKRFREPEGCSSEWHSEQ